MHSKLPSGKAILKRDLRWSLVSLPSGQSVLKRLNQSMIWLSVKLVFSMQYLISCGLRYSPVCINFSLYTFKGASASEMISSSLSLVGSIFSFFISYIGGYKRRNINDSNQRRVSQNIFLGRYGLGSTQARTHAVITCLGRAYSSRTIFKIPFRT